MDSFVPTRNKKMKEENQRKRKNECQEEQSKEQIKVFDKELREKMLIEYEKNDEFKQIFEEIKKDNDKKKEILNLAQFNRFYSFVKEKEYDFFDKENKLKKFIEKQLDRKYASKFYIFIWKEFCYQIPKSKLYKLENNIKLERKKIGEFQLEDLPEDNIKSIKENEILKNEIKEETEVKLKIIEGYLLYTLGRKRIKEKVKEE